MTFSKRVKKALDYSGQKQKELNEHLARLGCGKGVIERIVNRPDGRGSVYTAQIAKLCNVNPYWLTTGEGEMTIKLEGISQEAMLVGFAYQHLKNQDLRDRYAHEVLGVALNFMKTAHPEYKRLVELYRSVSKRRGIKAELTQEAA